MSCKLCRQTRQRCFSYICNSQVVKSNRVNDQNRAETCLLKADCGDCVAITAITLTAAIQERPMTHLQVICYLFDPETFSLPVLLSYQKRLYSAEVLADCYQDH